MLKFVPTQDPSWMKFAAASPDVTIFHHPVWSENLRDCYGYRDFVAVELEKDKIVAGLPMMEVKSLMGAKRLISLPFSDHCKPLAYDYGGVRKLTVSLTEWSERHNIPIEIRSKLPRVQGIQESKEYVVHTAALDTDAEIVLDNFTPKLRRYIRSQAGDDIRIEMHTSMESMKSFYHQQLITRRKHGLPAQPWIFFKNLCNKIIKKGLGFIQLAFHDDYCLGGLIVMYWGHTVTIKYSAIVNQYQKLRPQPFLIWNIMRWGCENHYKVLDGGRTDIDQMGLRENKRYYGYNEEILNYSYINCDPPMKKTQGMIGKVFLGIMRRSPLWFCKMAGDILYAHFP